MYSTLANAAAAAACDAATAAHKNSNSVHAPVKQPTIDVAKDKLKTKPAEDFWFNKRVGTNIVNEIRKSAMSLFPPANPKQNCILIRAARGNALTAKKLACFPFSEESRNFEDSNENVQFSPNKISTGVPVDQINRCGPGIVRNMFENRIEFSGIFPPAKEPTSPTMASPERFGNRAFPDSPEMPRKLQEQLIEKALVLLDKDT